MSFWDEWLDELDRQPDMDAVRRLSQGARLFQSLALAPTGAAPFDLEEWARGWSRRWRLELTVAPGTPLRREGQAEYLAALLRALCWEQFPSGCPPLQVTGDQSEIRVVCAQESRWVPRPGVLVSTLADLLPVQLGRDGSWLFRCNCPSLETAAALPEAVDLDTLQRSTMDDPEFEDELIDAFLEEGTRQMEHLGRDYNSRTLHSLKGSANMVGALTLAGQLGEQEHRLELAQLPALKQEFERVRAWLVRYRAQRGVVSPT